MSRFHICVVVTYLCVFYQHVGGLVKINTLIDTLIGSIEGRKAADGDYFEFLGIPYASVNKSNPFEASTPYPDFEKTFEALDDSAICPQPGTYPDKVQTTDCLRLNVYVPSSASSRNQLAVMVWIHGGKFTTGYGSLYGAKHIVKHDVILVTFNYRLGPYGFMCLTVPEVAGNQGLKDQLLALKWVKKNIDSFGGNNEKITLFGQGAGAASVDLHLTSVLSTEYNQAILQSGTALTPVFHEPKRAAPIDIARHLRLRPKKVNDALTLLANTSPESVINAVIDLEMKFTPCVELPFDSIDQFLTIDWYRTPSYKVENKTVLIGFTNDETFYDHYFENEDHFKDIDFVKDRLALVFDTAGTDFDYRKFVVQHFYFGDDNYRDENYNLAAITFDSDFKINWPIHLTTQYYFAQSISQIYLYTFSYVGGRNIGNIHNKHSGLAGAAHKDELGYLFDMYPLTSEEVTPEDQLTIDRMTTMWTNFAKHGDPTPEVTRLLPVKWSPITLYSSFYYLDIDTQLVNTTRPFKGRIAFWELFFELNKPFIRLPGQPTQ